MGKPMSMQLEAQRNQSQFRSAPPELRQTQHEQDEILGQNCSHPKLIELLISMRQEIKERDNQLKTQLQLMDEYFEAELKKGTNI